jgi:hypothetical protein
MRTIRSAAAVPLLQHNHSNHVRETAWQLGARPEEEVGAATPDEAEIRPDGEHGDTLLAEAELRTNARTTCAVGPSGN